MKWTLLLECCKTPRLIICRCVSPKYTSCQRAKSWWSEVKVKGFCVLWKWLHPSFLNIFQHIPSAFSMLFQRTWTSCIDAWKGRAGKHCEEALQNFEKGQFCSVWFKAALKWHILNTPTSCSHAADLDLGLGSRQGIVWLETVTLVFTQLLWVYSGYAQSHSACMKGTINVNLHCCNAVYSGCGRRVAKSCLFSHYHSINVNYCDSCSIS